VAEKVEEKTAEMVVDGHKRVAEVAGLREKDALRRVMSTGVARNLMKKMLSEEEYPHEEVNVLVTSIHVSQAVFICTEEVGE